MLEKQYEAVLFDLDGTLLDTMEGTVAGVQAIIDAMGYRKLAREELESFVGPPMVDSMMHYFQLDQEEAYRVAALFRDQQDQVFAAGNYGSKLFDGVMEILGKLWGRGTRIGVATLKQQHHATMVLEHFGIAPYCHVIRGADIKNLRTKADLLRECMDALQISDPSQVLLIGDSEFDAYGAREAGVDFLAVTYGFGFRSQAEALEYGALATADSMGEAAAMLGL